MKKYTAPLYCCFEQLFFYYSYYSHCCVCCCCCFLPFDYFSPHRRRGLLLLLSRLLTCFAISLSHIVSTHWWCCSVWWQQQEQTANTQEAASKRAIIEVLQLLLRCVPLQFVAYFFATLVVVAVVLVDLRTLIAPTCCCCCYYRILLLRFPFISVLLVALTMTMALRISSSSRATLHFTLLHFSWRTTAADATIGDGLGDAAECHFFVFSTLLHYYLWYLFVRVRVYWQKATQFPRCAYRKMSFYYFLILFFIYTYLKYTIFQLFATFRTLNGSALIAARRSFSFQHGIQRRMLYSVLVMKITDGIVASVACNHSSYCRSLLIIHRAYIYIYI